VIKSGKIVLFWREDWRPGLDYLRGDIGVSDEKWDGAVLTALEELRTHPSKTLHRWEKLRILVICT